MAILSRQNDFTVSSLRENLTAIEYCLSYKKSDDGCLGIPAMILICSIIDTIGSYYRGANYGFNVDNIELKIEKASEHFYILNHEKYFNLNLSKITIEDFYSTYRSKLTHNASLPPNNYLYIDQNEEALFGLDSDKKILKINLYPLFKKVSRACNEFIYHLENSNFSDDHKLSNELNTGSKTIFFDDQIHSESLPPASGVTSYDNYKL